MCYLVIDPGQAGLEVALPLDGPQIEQVPAALKSPRSVAAAAQPHHRTHDPAVAFHVALQYLHTNIYMIFHQRLTAYNKHILYTYTTVMVGIYRSL